MGRSSKAGRSAIQPKGNGRGRGNTTPNFSQARQAAAAAAARREAVTRLESAFIKLPAQTLQCSRFLASLPLLRPISPELTVLCPNDLGGGKELQDKKGTRAQDEKRLRLPNRPRWRFEGMSKRELEANERAVFENWLEETDGLMESMEQYGDGDGSVDRDGMPVEETGKIGAVVQSALLGGYYERNLDVWRQLWRVTERSDILLVLVDCRCPLIHYPPSLDAYLSRFSRLKIILVLTKKDLVPDAIAERWEDWFRKTYPGISVVSVESYQKEKVEEGNTDPTRPRRREHIPYISPSSRRALFAALRKAHEELLTPPKQIASRPERLRNWTPRVQERVDWDAAEAGSQILREAVDEEGSRKYAERPWKGRGRGPGRKEKLGKEAEEYLGQGSKAERKKARRLGRIEDLEAKAQRSREGLRAQKAKADVEASAAEEGDDGDDGDDNMSGEGVSYGDGQAEKSEESEASSTEAPADDHGAATTSNPRINNFLTVGLIGQPNVGKSSLLNALLGGKFVRASKTPGKTKHFQTFFLTDDIRLCDCPGLVFPSFFGAEMQVLSSIIPISQVQDVVGCVRYLATLLPLERVLSLPDVPQDDFDDDTDAYAELHRREREARRLMMSDKKPGAEKETSKEQSWTAMSLLETLAKREKILTAKAGRPDVNRVGNAVLRAAVESRIRWAFRPPDGKTDVMTASGVGILLTSTGDDGSFKENSIIDFKAPGRDTEDEGVDGTESNNGFASEEEGREEETSRDNEEESIARHDGNVDVRRGGKGIVGAASLFAALTVEGHEVEEDEDEDDEEHNEGDRLED